MTFVDEVDVEVRAGRGGDGSAAMGSEPFKPKGGPDGGDGGRGGDVVLVCDGSLRDLNRFRHNARYGAGAGGRGEGGLRHGADGDDLVLAVPPGTAVELEDG